MTDLRQAAQQALEALGSSLYPQPRQMAAIAALRAALAQQAEPVKPVAWANIDSDRLRVDPATGNVSIGAQQAEPVAGKVVAWGVFALADGEWQLQHPVFVGDECGKENAEFERASYSGPQPLEVRPLGVVTATAQQAEPVKPVAWSGYDLDGMVEAFSRVIEARYQRANPFQNPIDMDAQMALRILRGFIPAMKAYTAPPQRKPLTDEDILRVLMLDPPNPSLWPHLKGEAIVGDVQQAVLAIVRAVERALEEKNRGR